MNNVTGSLALWLLVGSGCGMRWLERMGMWIGHWPSTYQIMGAQGNLCYMPQLCHEVCLTALPTSRVLCHPFVTFLSPTHIFEKSVFIKLSPTT